MRCQKGQRSSDKMFDFHPSFQTVTLDPRAGPAVTHPSIRQYFNPLPRPREILRGVEEGFLRTRQPVTPEEWRGCGLREGEEPLTVHTLYTYILCVWGIINHIRQEQGRSPAVKLVDHDSASRGFTENDETLSSPELPAGRILSGR